MVEAKDYQGPREFVHLNLHTVFSPLIGVATPEKFVERCKAMGHPAIATTEHGSMASVPDMYFACKKKGIKFIPGCDCYYNDYEPVRREIIANGGKVADLKGTNSRLLDRIMKNRYLTVLCKNETGFYNLVKLTTMANKFGFFHKPRIWLDKLIEHKEGLIVLSGGLNGPIAHELFLDIDSKELDGTLCKREERDRNAIDYVKAFKEEFKDDFYIELRMPCMPETYDDKIFWVLNALADKMGVKKVLTNACYYLEQGDQETQRMLAAIDQKTNIYDPNLVFVDTDQQWYKSRADLWETFKNNPYSKKVSDQDFETMCDNTLEIADKCTGLKPDTSPKIPDWGTIEVGTNADDLLREKVFSELSARGLDKIDRKFIIDGREVTYTEQAEIECERFIDKGFASYFLITEDLVKYGKNRGWPFGPRGCSTPDSLIDVVGCKKKIVDIEIGDLILDGFGDERVVENKFIYDVSEDLYIFEIGGGVIEVTADHKLYIVRDDVVHLLPASEIKDTDKLIGNLKGQMDNYHESSSDKV